jgi:AcrR family transcriptional regulator
VPSVTGGDESAAAQRGAGAGATRRTQAERSAATRAALVTAARRLFAERGYAATGREQIVAAAGVTRGALYHHFTGKEELFRAVYEQLEVEIVARVIEVAATAGDPMDQLRFGIRAYLDVARQPDVQRVMLLDAPSVLDWETRREIVEAHALGLVRAGLQSAMDAGLLERQPVVPLAHVLLAALHEAALYVARAPDDDAAAVEVAATLDHLLDGLRTGGSRGQETAPPPG